VSALLKTRETLRADTIENHTPLARRQQFQSFDIRIWFAIKKTSK
jgi:hypothetical protein